MQRVQVRFLVQELTSHMLWGMAPKKEFKKGKHDFSWTHDYGKLCTHTHTHTHMCTKHEETQICRVLVAQLPTFYSEVGYVNIPKYSHSSRSWFSLSRHLVIFHLQCITHDTCMFTSGLAQRRLEVHQGPLDRTNFPPGCSTFSHP